MKYIKSIFAGLLMASAVIMFSHAASLPRSPKMTFVTPYSTAGSSVAIAAVAASSSPVTLPGAIYQVTLSSGASSEYIVLVDTNTCTGVTLQGPYTAPTKYVVSKLLYSSTTANTNFAFDPPLMFDLGLCVFDSASTGQASITYELGRGINGN